MYREDLPGCVRCQKLAKEQCGRCQNWLCEGHFPKSGDFRCRPCEAEFSAAVRRVKESWTKTALVKHLPSYFLRSCVLAVLGVGALAIDFVALWVSLAFHSFWLGPATKKLSRAAGQRWGKLLDRQWADHDKQMRKRFLKQKKPAQLVASTPSAIAPK